MKTSSPAFEAERANLYSMIGDLLCEPPSPAAIAAATSALEADRPPPELAMARALLLRALQIGADSKIDASTLELPGCTLSARAGHIFDLVMHRERGGGHAGNCLFELALYLQSNRVPFFAALGVALRELIERDGALSMRWLALTVHTIRAKNGDLTVQSLVRCPQHAGDAVDLDCCTACGRWSGIQFGGKDQRSMILCRVDDRS